MYILEEYRMISVWILGRDECHMIGYKYLNPNPKYQDDNPIGIRCIKGLYKFHRISTKSTKFVDGTGKSVDFPFTFRDNGDYFFFLDLIFLLFLKISCLPLNCSVRHQFTRSFSHFSITKNFVVSSRTKFQN